MKFEKENRQNPLNTISIVCFLQTRLFTEKFSRTGSVHPGIFRGRALWADGVSPPMNTIASRERFKPIRIGENLVVNYNCYSVPIHWLVHGHMTSNNGTVSRQMP